MHESLITCPPRAVQLNAEIEWWSIWESPSEAQFENAPVSIAPPSAINRSLAFRFQKEFSAVRVSTADGLMVNEQEENYKENSFFVYYSIQIEEFALWVEIFSWSESHVVSSRSWSINQWLHLREYSQCCSNWLSVKNQVHWEICWPTRSLHFCSQLIGWCNAVNCNGLVVQCGLRNYTTGRNSLLFVSPFMTLQFATEKTLHPPYLSMIIRQKRFGYLANWWHKRHPIEQPRLGFPTGITQTVQGSLDVVKRTAVHLLCPLNSFLVPKLSPFPFLV